MMLIIAVWFHKISPCFLDIQTIKNLWLADMRKLLSNGLGKQRVRADDKAYGMKH